MKYTQSQANQSAQLYFCQKKNETQCVVLFCLLSRFMTYAPFFIPGKLSLEKIPLNLGS